MPDNRLARPSAEHSRPNREHRSSGAPWDADDGPLVALRLQERGSHDRTISPRR